MTSHKQPSKALRRAVKEAFDADQLRDMCVRQDFSSYADYYGLEPSKRDGHERFYWYRDNGSGILATAHLDSVQSDPRCSVVDTSAGLLACSGALDDRLGAYVILDMLPRLGIMCDVLLTTDEESCHSTADAFETDKPYNWLFSFDRGGTDVVMYDYETPELCQLVRNSGAQVGNGSFSDICVLEHLGAAGFNWGVGYQDYHSSRSHAWLEDTFRMVARFVKFYRVNVDLHLSHTPYDRWATTDDDEEEYARWWAKNGQDFIVADCGHEIDLADARTFIDDGAAVVCTSCGTIDKEAQAWS